MAKGKKKDAGEDEPIEAVDLIALLTPPGHDGRYETEITAPEPGEEFDLLAFVPESIPAAPAERRPVTPSHLRPVPDKPVTTAPKPAPTLPAPPNPAIPTAAKTGTARLKPLPEIPDDSLTKIIEEVAACQKCDLCKTRKKTVPGVGNPHARLVFIGEAPGADEDASGIPFVGRAGQHLDKILAAAGFKREEVYICNILKCRPPENRDPALTEMLACTPFLQRQLRLLKPQLIACLGNVAVKFVIGPDSPGITRIHGQWFTSIFGIPTMAMYHPSYLIRSTDREKGSPNWQMWQDIQALKKRYDEFSG